MNRIILPDTTLVCVDCIDPMGAWNILESAWRICGGREIKLFSDKEPGDLGLPSYAQKIPKITSLKEYSKFIVADLYKYIDTEFVLIMQRDGYPVNPTAWTNLFLKYDYIGAPWVRHLYYDIPGYPTVNDYNMVGNGGFSLRTKKLLEATSKISKERDMYEGIGEFEDCYIARTIQRQLIEEEGINFAPVGLALGFSIENQQYSGQFGFHGKRTYEMNKDIIDRTQYVR